MSLIQDWNPKQAALKDALAKPEMFEEAIRLCLELHESVHAADMSGAEKPTLFDELWRGLTRTAFEAMPTEKDVTIAWNIWHIARIEDLTANILIADSEQVLSDERLKKLGVAVRDTGNAMTDDEILNLSRSLDMDELRDYRTAVGKRTREIVSGLSVTEFKRKMKPESVRRILAEGGVTEHKDSIWLLDFWGKKTVAGILLMPITRHQIMHISDSFKLKERLAKHL